MEWLRLYNEIVDDPKMAKLSDAQFRCFMYLLCIANTQNERGKITMTNEEIAWRLRIPIDEITSTVTILCSLNIIENGGNYYSFVHWAQRQFVSDDVNVRVKRYRSKGVTLHETLHETLENRTDTEQIQNRTKHKKPMASELPNWLPKEQWQGFVEMRNRIKKPLTKRAISLIWGTLQKIHSDNGDNYETILDQSTMNSWQGLFPVRKEQNGSIQRNSGHRYGRPGRETSDLDAESQRELDEIERRLERRERNAKGPSDIPDHIDGQRDPGG